MNDDYICTFVDCQYGLDISKVNNDLNKNLFQTFNEIQYVKTSIRNDTELTTVYRLLKTNVTYNFIVCLPSENNITFPGIYYSYHDSSRYKPINPGNVNGWYNKLKEQLNTISALDFNDYIEAIRNAHKRILNTYCGNICIKTIEDAKCYYDLYTTLLESNNNLEMGIYKLASVKSYITHIKSKIDDIKRCNNTNAQLDSIINECRGVINNREFQDKTLKRWFNDIATYITNIVKPMVETYHKYQITNTITRFINPKYVEIITRYLKLNQIQGYSLKALIRLLDKYHETHPIPPVDKTKDENDVVLSKYSSIYIPYNNIECNWIDYSIHYKYYVDMDYAYWMSNTVRLVQIDTIDGITTIDSTAYRNKTLLTKELSNLDQDEQEKWLVVIDPNVKPKNGTLDANKFISNAIQFILSYNEFLHLEPNTTPDINLRTQK